MTRSYNVCERFEVNMDSMPREDSRLSGRVGCSNFGTSDRLFGRDHLEDELDPVLSAAVRFNKSKSKGLIGLKYVLLCLIALLAIILLTIALFIIFSQSSSVSAYASNGENQEVRRVIITDEDKETERWTEAYQRNELADVTHNNVGEEVIETFHDVLFQNKRPKIESGLLQAEHVRTGHHPPIASPSTVLESSTSMPTTPSLTLTQRPISLRTYLWTHAPPKSLSSSTITTTSTVSTTTTTQEKSIFLSPIGEVVDCEHFRNKGKGSGANQLSVPITAIFMLIVKWNRNKDGLRTSGKWPFWNASFDEYSYGFGDLPDGDHWLGLDRVSAFVESNRRLEMRIRLQGDFCVSKACSGLGDDGNWWGDWKFKILSRDEGYRITDLEYLRGNLSDPNQPEKDLFTQLCNNRSFTTVDVDNDENKYENCAKFRRRGAWWHGGCAYTSLNGLYGDPGNKPSGQFWHWRSAIENITHKSYEIKPKKSLILFRVVQ
uniref:Fibrinogen C-terminal domain-containing protein n=1 Tax=Meloidogyne enterolobii TaxID=390850 RepID=A0A6V7WQR3_MELEN|nr:unnamed protein product [Meloidogyne enterolobii]